MTHEGAITHLQSIDAMLVRLEVKAAAAYRQKPVAAVIAKARVASQREAVAHAIEQLHRMQDLEK